MVTHPPPQTRPAPHSLLPRLLTGLTLLGVAMTGTAVLAPGIALSTGGGDHPDYAVIAGTGVVMIALSSLFLAYASRLVGLGGAWLGLAVLTNALVLVARFVLAPLAFYQTTFVEGDPLLNVTSPAFFPTVAAGLFVLTGAGLGIRYAWQRGRVSRALGEDRELRRHDVLVGLLTVALTLGIPTLVLSSVSLIGYGMAVAAATGGASILVALLAMATGTGAMVGAGQASVSARSTAVLTSAFWLTLSVLLVSHAVWVVFMAVLVSLWPLKTVAPSGK